MYHSKELKKMRISIEFDPKDNSMDGFMLEINEGRFVYTPEEEYVSWDEEKHKVLAELTALFLHRIKDLWVTARDNGRMKKALAV